MFCFAFSCLLVSFYTKFPFAYEILTFANYCIIVACNLRQFSKLLNTRLYELVFCHSRNDYLVDIVSWQWKVTQRRKFKSTSCDQFVSKVMRDG